MKTDTLPPVFARLTADLYRDGSPRRRPPATARDSVSQPDVTAACRPSTRDPTLQLPAIFFNPRQTFVPKELTGNFFHTRRLTGQSNSRGNASIQLSGIASQATSQTRHQVPSDNVMAEDNEFVEKATKEFEDILKIPRAAPKKQCNTLAKALFQLQISSQGNLRSTLLARNPDELQRDLLQITTRCGLRQMTADDFHAVLADLLHEDGLKLSETRCLFDLFDVNHSGLVDVAEFLEGMRVLHLDDYTMMLAYCRKLFTESRNYRDTVLSANEISLLLSAVLKYYRLDVIMHSRLQNEVASVMRLVWEHAHKGQLSVHMLRNFVQRGSTLFHAISNVSTNRAFVPSKTPEIPDVAAAISSVLAVAPRKDAYSSRRYTDSTDFSRSQRGTQERLTRKSTVVLNPSRNTDAAIDEKIDFYHPRFRCDANRSDDWARQRKAKEHGDPIWYVLRDQVWKKADGLDPVPIFDA